MTEWYEFGTLLCIPPSDLHGIKVSHPQDGIKTWKIEMFRLWLRSDPNASWKDVVQALEKAKNFTLAARLKKKYLLPRIENKKGINISRTI